MTLRKFRVVISWLVFILFLSAFLAGEQFAIILAPHLSYFQFTPSLLKFILTTGIFSSLGFLIVIVLTFLFGRVYCSFLCPLGIFQDIVIYFSKKMRKISNHYQKPYPQIRYGILITTLILPLLGMLSILSFLDPYSFFGHIMTNLINPFIISMNNLFVPLLENYEIYTLSILSLHHLPLSILILDLIFLSLLLVMSILHGRMFCNTLCPVGTILGLISKHSRYRITFISEKCTQCGVCKIQCRGECIQYEHATVDLSRCVACYDCIDSCPQSGIKLKKASDEKVSIDLSKRKFLLGTTSAVSSIILLGGPLRSVAKQYIPVKYPITPPGSKGIEHFMDLCSSCYQCVNHCPTKIISPTLADYGLRGLLQPALDFKLGYCDYECNTCSQICPTGAIQKLSLEEKQLTQIGKVHLSLKNCIVETKKKDCGACAEVCPTHSVYMVERNRLFHPETHPSSCIGCGHCEYICPSVPKAIIVLANTIHKKAKPAIYPQFPRIEKIPSGKLEDFPF